MTKTIRKTSIVLALLMAILMVFTLLPLNVKAQETISITEDVLDEVKNSSTHEDTQKGIRYEGNTFKLYKAAEYCLDDDIDLDGDNLDISSESGPSTLNLNNHDIEGTDIPEDGAIINSLNTLTIKGGGEIFINDENGVAVHAMKDLIIQGGEYDGIIISDENAFVSINGADIWEDVAFDGPIAVSDIFIDCKFVANNTANISGGEFGDAVYLYSDTVISGGTFNDKILTAGEGLSLSISGGSFKGELIIAADTEITGGVFNDEVNVWGGTVIIDDGEFKSVNLVLNDAELVIYGGNFYDTCSFNAGEGYIFGGNFEYKGNSDMIISLHDASLLIWDGDFYNLDESEYAPADYIIFASDILNNTSLEIFGGYFGVSEKAAVACSQIKKLGIYGGEFVSKGYAVVNLDNGNTNVKIAGGKFTSLGTWKVSYAPSAALMNVFDDGNEYKDNLFESYLHKGFEYVPGVETNKAFDGDVVKAAYTQLELRVLPKNANLVSDEENADLNDQVNALINKLKSGESVEGISPELAEMILDAIAEGKDISVEMSVTPVNPEDITEDANKVTALVGNDGKVAAYFEVNIAINIEGETVGFITKLDDGVLIKLPIPEGLSDPESGLLREWKIVRVHNGIASELEAEAGDGYVSGKSAEFSTYALVYNDATTPATGDSGITGWISLAFIVAGAMIATVVYKNRFSAKGGIL